MSVKLTRLQHTNAPEYGGPLLVSSMSANANVDVVGNLYVNGLKNFKIVHPDPKKSKKYMLIHSALEGPEAGVYWRISFEMERFCRYKKINLPEYWSYLVEEYSTQVFLSSQGSSLTSFVQKIINDKTILIKKKNIFKKEFINCLVFGVRKLKKEFIIEEERK